MMLAGALIREPRLANPTLVLITDRNNLDDQLFDTFEAGSALLWQDTVQATSRDQLRQLLDRAAGLTESLGLFEVSGCCKLPASSRIGKGN